MFKKDFAINDFIGTEKKLSMPQNKQKTLLLYLKG